MSTLNGISRDRPPVRTAPERDPLEGVLGLGPRLPANVLAAALAFALVLHAGVAAAASAAVVFADMLQWQRMVAVSIEAKISQTFDIDVLKPEPEPEPEPPAEEELKEEPKPEPPPVKEDAPREQEPPPPPEAAQAGAVVTQEPSLDEPVDLTDNTFVTGSGSTYSGGTTQAGGTSQKAVYDKAASALGVPGGTGTAPAPPPAPKVDRSRAASLVNKANLERCPWPSEADAEQMDEASVLVEIKVRPNGTAESVAVLQDPGHGFGREARKCAMRERYNPALDVNGLPIASGYKVRLHFER
jgi:periplasmic protein TonB